MDKKESETIIVATMGPACEKKEVIDQMVKHHMNMVRFNFSWGEHEKYLEYIKTIREVAKENNVLVPILQDLSGPRVQVGKEHHFGGDEKIITEKDKKDLKFGVENGIEYIALSFVGKAEDIIELKQLIKNFGGQQKVIAKIERREAFENINEILREADGVMVARGDLGNEFPIEEIPFIQHEIIEASRKAGKMVIVATQMLETMIENENPTRAEVTDVAYAILDGANAVMLSAESAVGKYPVKAISIMERIALVAEKHQEIIIIGK
jgi:pyruvate kinase